MSEARKVEVAEDAGSLIESVITKGDLAKLSQQERTKYYFEVCKSVGLNPLTKPLEYITLNGKLVLYALRGCTDQLRTIHGVSVVDMIESERDGVYVVTVKVENRDKRTDMAKGAVAIANLKGDALANAIMKCETKAKRRATLSICGLGMLDETEIETIPSAVRAPVVEEKASGPTALGPTMKPMPQGAVVEPPVDPETGEAGPHAIAVPLTAKGSADWIKWGGQLVAALNACETREEGEAWLEKCDIELDRCERDVPPIFARIEKRIAEMRARLPEAEFMEVEERS